MNVPNLWHRYENVLTTKDELLSDIIQFDKVYIGCDSKYYKQYTIFAYAICFKSESYGVNYYWCREKTKGSYKDLYTRIWGEVERSVMIGNWIRENNPNISIEIHADINSNPIFASNVYNAAANGYITGCGYQYRCKPDAWAATSVADWYTR